jgi:hypothetical protein
MADKLGRKRRPVFVWDDGLVFRKFTTSERARRAKEDIQSLNGSGMERDDDFVYAKVLEGIDEMEDVMGAGPAQAWERQVYRAVKKELGDAGYGLRREE